MPALTITPDPATGSTRLTILSAAVVSGVQRSDANGTQDVRTLPGIFPYAPALVEELRNLVRDTTNGVNYNLSRCTLTGGVGSSYTRWTALGTGSTYIYYNGYLGGTGPGVGMLPVVPGDKISARIDIRNVNAFGIRARLDWVFYDAAVASVPGTVTGAVSTMAAGGYATPTTTATVPAGAAYARPLIYWFDAAGANPVAGTMLDAKYMSTFKGANAFANAAGFFHGAYASSADYEYSWAGTSYASESIRKVPAGALVIDDYEAAAGSASYTVTTATGPLEGGASLDLGAPWLGIPVTPQFSARAETITGYDAAIESRATVLEPDGGFAPIVITRGGSSRRGSMDIWAGTYAAALALLRVAQRGQVVMLRQPEHPGMDMFFSASRAGITTLTPNGAKTTFGVRLDYIEVGRPNSPLAGALGWTWGELKNSYATWGDLFKAYATWGDVRINRRKP